MDKSTYRAASADEQSVSSDHDEPFGRFAPGLVQRLIIGVAFGTVFGRGNMRRWLSTLVARLGTPVDIVRTGCKFRLYLGNNLIDFGILMRKGYNGVDIGFLQEVLGPGRVGVDIGCNIGLYALQLAKTEAEVVAIDANPLMISRIRFNAAANGFSKLQIYECAVGDRAAKANLQIRRDDLAIVRVVEEDSGSVEIRPLMDILNDAGVGRVDALKIDVEGYEDKALAPFLASCGEAFLPKRIVIEEKSDQDNPACHEVFRQKGYELVQRTRTNGLYERRG